MAHALPNIKTYNLMSVDNWYILYALHTDDSTREVLRIWYNDNTAADLADRVLKILNEANDLNKNTRQLLAITNSIANANTVAIQQLGSAIRDMEKRLPHITKD